MVALDEGQVEITQNDSNARNLLEKSGFPPVPRPLGVDDVLQYLISRATNEFILNEDALTAD
jgi:hypothetical protein